MKKLLLLPVCALIVLCATANVPANRFSKDANLKTFVMKSMELVHKIKKSKTQELFHKYLTKQVLSKTELATLLKATDIKDVQSFEETLTKIKTARSVFLKENAEDFKDAQQAVKLGNEAVRDVIMENKEEFEAIMEKTFVPDCNGWLIGDQNFCAFIYFNDMTGPIDWEGYFMCMDQAQAMYELCMQG